MLSVRDQLESGRLVCPRTHQPLRVEGEQLVTADGQIRYPFRDGVPILLAAEEQKRYLTEDQGSMAAEYAGAGRTPSRLGTWIGSIAAEDYRSEASRLAFRQTVEMQPEDALCLAVGGGPHHVHPKLVNLNIGHFANVHVVGDAYELPYGDGSVDAVHCEAVLEHLELPDRAVAEMFRVLRPGGQLFVATPFMQPFHAYPNHFQNFTVVGQERLLQRAGFAVISSGVCVGPSYALASFLFRFVSEYVRLPLLGRLMAAGAGAAGLLLRRLDRRLNRRPNAHLLASTTYVHARKPGAL